MNAYTDFPGEATPALTVRDRRFGRGATPERWWAGGDPIATAWFNALSATFPRGEMLFIDAVKAFRDDAPPRLAAEIRAFIKQEVNHTREHLAFNRAAEAAGYDMQPIEVHVERMIGQVYQRPKHGWLAVTIALEHFTAMFAHEFLAHPQHFAGAETEQAELWRWHAVEEIEHKGVAYDTWLHATRSWPRGKRWKVKAKVMLYVTRNFIVDRTAGALELLRQDGITGPRAWSGLMWHMWIRPGMFRKIAAAWAKFFLPGFHPWNEDDRHLLRAYEASVDAVALDEPTKKVRSAA